MKLSQTGNKRRYLPFLQGATSAIIRKKIQKQNDELNTLETNIQFFSNSKGAEKLIAPIMKQIETIKANSSQLKDKNKLLNQSINLLRD